MNSVVGDGSQRSALEELARQLNIGGITNFAGYVAPRDLPEHLWRMDVFVMPSHMESFGVAAAEAQACGLPVVASQVGGLPECVVDGVTGYLVPPRSPDAIARRLADLMDDAVLREGMGAAARRHAEENLDASQMGERIEALYREVLSR